MNNIDIAVGLILILSTLVGFVRGGLSSLLSTIGWIGAIIGNHYIFNHIEPFLQLRLQSKILSFLIGYVGGLFLLLFVFSIVNFLILSLLNQFRGGTIDKVIGFIFGLTRGIIILGFVFLAFETSMKALSGKENSINDYPDILLDAKTLPIMKKLELKLLNYIPDNFKDSLSFKMSEDNITDMTLLNLVMKLSSGMSKNEINKINKSIDNNSQYMSQRDILITKIRSLWKYHNKNGSGKVENLSQDEIEKIKLLVDVREK
jgi:membrane protein required for colicin V production